MSEILVLRGGLKFLVKRYRETINADQMKIDSSGMTFERTSTRFSEVIAGSFVKKSDRISILKKEQLKVIDSLQIVHFS